MFDICSVRSILYSSQRFLCSKAHSRFFLLSKNIVKSSEISLHSINVIIFKKVTFQGILGFFLLDGDCSFNISSFRDFKGAIVIPSITCPKILTRKKGKNRFIWACFHVFF